MTSMMASSSCDPSALVVPLSDGDDVLEPIEETSVCALGYEGEDILVSGEQADGVWGGDGADEIAGGAGSDTLVGGLDADQLVGDSGNDTLWGGAGDDQLDGGDDADVLLPGSGQDIVIGGAGDDTMVVLHACELDEGTSFDGGPGHDVVLLPAGIDSGELATLGVDVLDVEEFGVVDVEAFGVSDCDAELGDLVTGD